MTFSGDLSSFNFTVNPRCLRGAMLSLFNFEIKLRKTIFSGIPLDLHPKNTRIDLTVAQVKTTVAGLGCGSLVKHLPNVHMCKALNLTNYMAKQTKIFKL